MSTRPGQLQWTVAKRTAANLLAMKLVAEKRPEALTYDDRRAIAAYSGWGGLSIRAIADKVPPGFPLPEERGLIHEYYTPTRVAREVARVVAPLLPDLEVDGVVNALEPSAGIGRFLHAFGGPEFEALRWHVIEWSALSERHAVEPRRSASRSSSRMSMGRAPC